MLAGSWLIERLAKSAGTREKAKTKKEKKERGMLSNVTVTVKD